MKKTQDSVWPHFQTPQSFKNIMLWVVFSAPFSVFDKYLHPG